MKGCPVHPKPQITCVACGDLVAKRLREVMRGAVKEKPAENGPSFRAFPEDGFIALHIPKEMIPPAEILAASDGVLMRIRSAEGFRLFVVAAVEHAALVWPEVAQEWKDRETDQ